MAFELKKVIHPVTGMKPRRGNGHRSLLTTPNSKKSEKVAYLQSCVDVLPLGGSCSVSIPELSAGEAKGRSITCAIYFDVCGEFHRVGH